MKKIITLVFLLAVTLSMSAQSNFSIKGEVIDRKTREPLPFVNVVFNNTTLGTTTDAQGKFVFNNVKGGTYRLKASYVGYQTAFSAEFMIQNNSTYITIEMNEASVKLNEVSVVATPIRRTVESPVALHLIGFTEIEKSAGSGRDISRVVQSFPGVASSPSGYRNDLIVRGGGPSENRFYVDGVEVPNINHFSTQGASGGPVGLINADLIQDVNFYTGAFPASKGNALSSILDFRLKEGNPEHRSLSFVLGTSDIGLSSDGNIGDKVTYLVSVRQSYLQFLFKALNLPFLPTFTDAQYKVKYRPNKKNELTLLGIVGIDDMKLNTDTVGQTDYNKYTLSYLPIIKQYTVTNGLVYKHYAGNHVQTVVASRNVLLNNNIKYLNNDESLGRTQDLSSKDAENKLRVENRSTLGDFRLIESLNFEVQQFDIDVFRKISLNNAMQDFTYKTDMNLVKWGLSVAGEYVHPTNKFTASVGLRTDAAGFNSDMQNPLNQLSPRASISYNPLRSFFINASAGRYYQLPPMTALSFRNGQGEWVNRSLKYQQADHYILGIEHRPANYARFTVEGFYKMYAQSPLSVRDQIPLSSKGADYGVIGNEPLTSDAEGRAYGVEAMARWYGYKNLNFIASYTWVRSEFKSKLNPKFTPSAWDNRHLFTFTGTYNLPKNWAIGAKYRFVGGAPYTPYDAESSALKVNWDAYGQGLLDYSKYNTERLPAFSQLDVRVDKTWYIKKTMLGFFLDFQNILNTVYQSRPVLLSTGVVENPDAPLNEQRYRMKEISSAFGNIIPALGIMVRL